MEGLACDVIGCKCSAAWVRISHLRPNTDDFLCNRCWTRLRINQPEEAACYIREEDPTSGPADAPFFEFADFEANRIGGEEPPPQTMRSYWETSRTTSLSGKQ